MMEKYAGVLQILSVPVFVVCPFSFSFFSAVGQQLVTWLGLTVHNCPVRSVAPGYLNSPHGTQQRLLVAKCNKTMTATPTENRQGDFLGRSLFVKLRTEDTFPFLSLFGPADKKGPLVQTTIFVGMYGCIQQELRKIWSSHTVTLESSCLQQLFWCPLSPPSGQLLNSYFYEHPSRYDHPFERHFFFFKLQGLNGASTDVYWTDQTKKQKIKRNTEETRKWQPAQMNPNATEKPQYTSEDNLEEPKSMRSWEAAGTLLI